MSRILYAAAIVALLGTGARAVCALSLAWDPSPSETAVGYEIYIGYAPERYEYAIDVGQNVTWPMPPLQAGRTHYIAVAAYDESGGLSALSNEVVYYADAAAVLPPTARMTVSPRTGPAPHRVRLSVETGGSIASYRWDFGNGSGFVSSSPPPPEDLVHEYKEPGAYFVRFYASGPAGGSVALQATPVIVTRPEGCPCSLFGAAVPRVGDGGPGEPISVGLRFSVLTDGHISALRIYTSPASKGPHVGTLWSAEGQALASVAFPSGGVTGWQEGRLPTPVSVTSGQVLVASYHAPQGHHAQDDSALLRGFSTGYLQIPPYRAGRGNGVFAYGTSSTFPDRESRGTNFGVDVQFLPAAAPAQAPVRAARQVR